MFYSFLFLIFLYISLDFFLEFEYKIRNITPIIKEIAIEAIKKPFIIADLNSHVAIDVSRVMHIENKAIDTFKYIPPLSPSSKIVSSASVTSYTIICPILLTQIVEDLYPVSPETRFGLFSNCCCVAFFLTSSMIPIYSFSTSYQYLWVGSMMHQYLIL